MHLLARRSLGALARLLVVLLTIGASAPVAAHGDGGHDPCETPGASSSRTSLHAASPELATQHCAVCHWLRTLRAFDVVVDQPGARAEGTPVAATPRRASTPLTPGALAPSRAPPA